MPFEITLEPGGILFTMTGDITASDIHRLDTTVYEYEEFPLLKYLIIDYTEAHSFIMSEDDVKDIAEHDLVASNENHDLIIAAISTDTQLIDALLLYDTYNGGHPWKSTLAMTMDDAREWIAENSVR